VSDTASQRSKSQVRTCASQAGAVRLLKRLVSPGDVVLFKASHSEHFEEIVKELREHWEPDGKKRRG